MALAPQNGPLYYVGNGIPQNICVRLRSCDLLFSRVCTCISSRTRVDHVIYKCPYEHKPAPTRTLAQHFEGYHLKRCHMEFVGVDSPCSTLAAAIL